MSQPANRVLRVPSYGTVAPTDGPRSARFIPLPKYQGRLLLCYEHKVTPPTAAGPLGTILWLHGLKGGQLLVFPWAHLIVPSTSKRLFLEQVATDLEVPSCIAPGKFKYMSTADW